MKKSLLLFFSLGLLQPSHASIFEQTYTTVVNQEIEKCVELIEDAQKNYNEGIIRMLVGCAGGIMGGAIVEKLLPETLRQWAVLIPLLALIPSVPKFNKSNQTYNQALGLFDCLAKTKIINNELVLVDSPLISHDDYCWALTANKYITLARALELTEEQILERAVSLGRNDIVKIITIQIDAKNAILKKRLITEQIEATKVRAEKDRQSLRNAA